MSHFREGLHGLLGAYRCVDGDQGEADAHKPQEQAITLQGQHFHLGCFDTAICSIAQCFSAEVSAFSIQRNVFTICITKSPPPKRVVLQAF